MTAPGWYADPRDPRLIRRWTGAEWTNEVAPKPGVAFEDRPAAPPWPGGPSEAHIRAGGALAASIGSIAFCVVWFIVIGVFYSMTTDIPNRVFLGLFAALGVGFFVRAVVRLIRLRS